MNLSQVSTRVKDLIRTALISVYDKTGLQELAAMLVKHSVKILASGGTARTIRNLGHAVTEVGEYTGFPESPDGLLKTLHPKIHGGLLMDPGNPVHMAYMKAQHVETIDLLVVNLYPFEETIRNEAVSEKKAFENIDIGGPAMIRAAAKGALLHGSPAVVTDPSQYSVIAEGLENRSGVLPPQAIRGLAIKAFEMTAGYECAISGYLSRVSG